MKAYSIAILLTTRGFAKQQQSCVAEYTSSTTVCSSLDLACICSTPGFSSGFACCISPVCSAADQQSAIGFVNALCASNGVTNLPTSAGCTSSISSATGGSVINSGIRSATTSHISTSLSSAASSVASSLSPGSSTTQISSRASALPSSPTPSSSPAPGLSTGAKAGIAVGAIAGVIIVLLALFLLLRKREIHKRKGPELQGNMQSRYDMPHAAELPAEKPTGTVQGQELETPANKHELESSKEEKTIQRGELATGANDHELLRPGSLTPEKFTTLMLGNELATPANTHELSTTAGKPMQRKDLPTSTNDRQLDVSTSPTRSPTWDREVVPEGAFGHSYLNEQDPRQNPAVAEPLPKQTFSQPFESVPIDPYIPESSRASSQTLLSESSIVAGSTARMDELRAKRDKIRLEKERLLKLQELDEMEAAVQKEMLEEARRAGGDGS